METTLTIKDIPQGGYIEIGQYESLENHAIVSIARFETMDEDEAGAFYDVKVSSMELCNHFGVNGYFTETLEYQGVDGEFKEHEVKIPIVEYLNENYHDMLKEYILDITKASLL